MFSRTCFGVQASLDRTVKLWDARHLGAGTGSGGVGGMKPLAVMPHFRSVNSAHFSPGGEWVATVGQDDKIRLYQDLAEASGSQVRLFTTRYVIAFDNVQVKPRSFIQPVRRGVLAYFSFLFFGHHVDSRARLV